MGIYIRRVSIIGIVIRRIGTIGISIRRVDTIGIAIRRVGITGIGIWTIGANGNRHEGNLHNKNRHKDINPFHSVTLSMLFLIARISLVSRLAGTFFPDQGSEYLLYLVFEYYRLLSFITYFVEIPA